VIQYNGLHFQVEKVERRRLLQVKLEMPHKQAEHREETSRPAA